MSADFNVWIDRIFTILLLLLCVSSIAAVFIKGIMAVGDPSMLERGVSSVIGTGGASGSAMLFMKWRVIVNSKVKLKSTDVANILNSSSDEK